MENASKALIMAGGMLLAILIVSLLIYAWSLFSEYQSSQDSLVEIENTAKFNEQFTAYDRDDVMGYELISLANKIVDYNKRMAETDGSQNDKKYSPITLKFSLGNDMNLIKEKFSSDDKMRWFISGASIKTDFTQGTAKNEISQLLEQTLRTESKDYFGSEDAATKLAKNADAIFIKDVTAEAQRRSTAQHTVTENDVKIEAIKTYNLNLPSSSLKKIDNYETNLDYAWNQLTGNGDNTNSIKYKVYQYWEFIQFKKAIFKCTGITYDGVSGRVSQINFLWQGGIK